MLSLKEKIENELISSLNDVQKAAVTHGQGPLLILAGAGSGKTRVITSRIAWLTRLQDVPPWNIAAVTFTNKVAREMQERLNSMIGPMAESVFVRTFHSMGLYILRRYPEAAGLKSSFSVYDESARKALVKELLKSEKADPKAVRPEHVLNSFSRFREKLQGPGEVPAGKDMYSVLLEKIYPLYLERLRANNAVDFDDLIFLSAKILQNYPEILSHFRNLWKYLLIDEYQDTNHAQYTMGRLIAAEHTNILAVGDDDQSIYSWRGADITNILEFEKDYPDCRILRLEENYRSTSPILKAASSVISRNEMRRGKTLYTKKEGGEPIILKDCWNDLEEADYVISEIRNLQRKGIKNKEIAVFYRTNAQSRVFETSFRSAGIPYILVGSFRFFDRKEVKDFMAYLSLIVNPEDSAALERIINAPPRGVGEAGLEKLKNLAYKNRLSLLEALPRSDELPRFKGAQALKELYGAVQSWIMAHRSGEMTLSGLAVKVLKESGYEDFLKNDKDFEAMSRLENLQAFIAFIQETEEQQESGPEPQQMELGEFLQRVMLLTSETEPDPERQEDSVSLMTLHNAKGLEFRCVFLTGFEQGYLPHSMSLESREGLEEERRLTYVGITRAMEKLWITYARNRRLFGTNQPRLVSQFLPELGDSLKGNAVSSRQHGYEGGNQPRTGMASSKEKWKEGDRCSHAKYGEGTIISTESTPAGQKLGIRFDGEDRVRNFLTAYTPLNKII